jgi:hypothetical protein
VRPEAIKINLPVSAGARHIEAPTKNRGRARYLVIILVIKVVQEEIDPRIRVIPEHTKDRSIPRTRALQEAGIIILSVAMPVAVNMFQGPTLSIARTIQHPTDGWYVRIM